MTVEEIMVGDLVTLEFGGEYPNETRCVSPADLNNKCFLKCARPIPISPEILEKNGFKQLDLLPGFDEWESEDRKIMINYRHQPPEKDYTVYITDYELVCSANIQYVHELQHALRLAGNKKEIIL